MSFGERLTNLLEEQDMSQKKLADELHMATTTINGYIKEHRQPDYSTLIQIAEYFHVSTDYLLGVTECRHIIEHPLTMREKGLVGLYRNMNPDKQNLLYEQAEFYQKIRRKEEGRPLRKIRTGEQKNKPSKM